MQQYEIVAKAELKAYAITQLQFMLLTAYNIGNSIHHIIETENNFFIAFYQ